MVSVCIPTYENVELFNRLIRSLIMQDYENLKVIVSDDSKTDKIFDAIKKINFPIKYHRNEKSLGSPKNWNNAISLAQGKYIHLIHHDDYYYSNSSLSNMVNKIELNQSDILFSACLWQSKIKLERVVRGINAERFLEIQQNRLINLLEINYLSVPSCMFFKNGLNFKYDEELIYLVDVDFYLNCIQQVGVKKVSSLFNPEIIINIEDETQITNATVNETIKKKEWHYLVNKWSHLLEKDNVLKNNFMKKVLEREGIQC